MLRLEYIALAKFGIMYFIIRCVQNVVSIVLTAYIYR